MSGSRLMKDDWQTLPKAHLGMWCCLHHSSMELKNVLTLFGNFFSK